MTTTPSNETRLSGELTRIYRLHTIVSVYCTDCLADVRGLRPLHLSAMMQTEYVSGVLGDAWIDGLALSRATAIDGKAHLIKPDAEQLEAELDAPNNYAEYPDFEKSVYKLQNAQLPTTVYTNLFYSSPMLSMKRSIASFRPMPLSGRIDQRIGTRSGATQMGHVR